MKWSWNIDFGEMSNSPCNAQDTNDASRYSGTELEGHSLEGTESWISAN